MVVRFPACRFPGKLEGVGRVCSSHGLSVDLTYSDYVMPTRRKLSKKKLSIVFLLFVALPASIVWLLTCGGEDQQPVPEVAVVEVDSIVQHSLYVDSLLSQPRAVVALAEKRRGNYGFRFRRGVDYHKGFPDMNDLQLATASRIGIAKIADREEAVRRKEELVYVGESPFYVIDELDYSIPYLVPRASRLLNEISQSFVDSLASRGLPFYKLFVTSVLRTEKDVKRLRRVNSNASENSCHQHGTTFDIAYNKYIPVYDPDSGQVVKVWPPELKQILAEVLDDLRRRGTCYVRYEVHQSCFHITAR